MTLALLALSLLAASPADLELAAKAEVRHKFEKIGRSLPAEDPVLDAAAKTLANDAIAARAADVADLIQVSDAVSQANGFDPSPRALVMRSSPPEYALDTLKQRDDAAADPTSHFGVGAAIDPSTDRGALVVLLADRKARLKPFNHSFAKAGAVQTLCGDLDAELSHAEIFVTAPNGVVQKPPLTREQGPSFCTTLTFPAIGRYTIEVLGTGPRGPEVAALFFVDVGGERARAATAHNQEPTTIESARAAILEKINALRKAQGAGPLVDDSALDKVAQSYSERMASENFFAHVAPDGEDMRGRLKKSGYLYRTAGENLGMAGGPLAAHFGIEHSPGHRRNLLEPAYTNAGIGVVFKKLPDRTQVIVTELYALPDHPSSDPLGDAYQTINRARASHGLKPLERSEVLEEIAHDHAKLALAANLPKSAVPGHQAVHERVFGATDFKSAAVDVMIADSLGSIVASKNALDPASDRIGVGAVKGDSDTYGQGKYWVVVIYAASR